MKEFLEEHGSEVENMLFSEVTIEDVIKITREESEAIGEARGKAIGEARVAINMVKEGFGLDVIARATGLPLEKVMELSQT